MRQLDKATWLVSTDGRGELTIGYDVYAFDTSVRAAFLDAGRGFFNGTSLFLKVDGAEVRRPPRRAAGFARGLAGRDHARRRRRRQRRPRPLRGRRLRRTGRHPVEMGAFWSGGFKAGGVPHRFVVAGAAAPSTASGCWPTRARICESADALLARRQVGKRGGSKRHAVFMLNAVDDGYGGLEHRAQHRADLRAPRPAARTREQRARAGRRLHHPARPDQPRVLPHLERQAPAAARVRPLRLRAARTTPSCCGSSRASPATTTTCCCAAPA